MIDPLSIIANSILGKIFKFVVGKISDFNNKRKNKRLFRNWIDFYRGKNDTQQS